jgi:curved DNA-binding protein CbpA
MSELSENLDEWPTDHLELLGVEKGADKKTLKRAYTRLIRRFKPDHFPDQFRRIREAYDEILEDLERETFFAQFNESPDEEEGDGLNDDELKQAEEVSDESIELWRLAVSGKMEEAINGFKKLFNEDPQAEVALKLYWLLKLSKKGAKELIDCLTASLEKDFDYRTANLLFSEMDKQPELLLNDDFLTLIKNISSDNTQSILPFVTKRWDVAFERKNFVLMVEDVEYLRKVLTLASEEDWTVLLLTLHKYISFADGAEIETALKKYHQEVESVAVSAGGYLDQELDQYEFLRAIRKIVRKGQADHIPAEWKEILAIYWTGNEKKYRHKLLKEMVEWCIDPIRALATFDALSYDCRSLFFAQIKRIVYSFSITQGPYIFINDEEKTKLSCSEYLRNRENLRYPLEKENLLHFCLNEDVPPDTLCDYILEKRISDYRWVLEISEDIHQAVYMAYKSMMSFDEFDTEEEQEDDLEELEA